MKRWLLVLGLLGGALSAPAWAERYWVSWEGNDYPENEGWEREGIGTRPARSITNGVMTLDSLASSESEDLYRMYRPLDPAPGEVFVVQWRLRVNEVDWDSPNFPYDPGVGISSNAGHRVSFAIGVSELHSIAEHQHVPFSPGEFHAWELRSIDMQAYTLSLDGSLVTTGSFAATGIPEPRIAWGDLVQSPTSSTDWDYFRFGVVPEPSTLLGSFLGICAFGSRRFR